MNNRILFSACGYDQGCSGISQYMLENVKEALEKYEVDIILSKNDYEYWPIQHKNQQIIILKDWVNVSGINAAWHLFILPLWIMYRQLICKIQYEYLFLPAINRRLCAFYPIASIGTLHDLSQFYVKNKYDALRMIYIKYIVRFFVKVNRNLHIVCVSRNTQQDLVKFYDYQSEVNINYNGYNKQYFNQIKPNAYDQILADNNLSPGYFIYVARIEHPGKNHLNLIKAYLQIDKPLRKKHPLVLVGKPWSGSEVIFNYIEDNDHDKTIKLLGFIDSEALPSLYHGAIANIMPSFYEGFCIPIIESMACKTLVCCADTQIMHEVTQDLALFFDPYDIAAIYHCLMNVLDDAFNPCELKDSAYDHAQSFDWKDHFVSIDKWVAQWVVD